MNMVKYMLVALAVVAGATSGVSQTAAQKLSANKTQISLADARSRIDKAIASPEVMAAIMKHLSAEDQKAFLTEVNKAITDMPASPEEKAATFLNANHAALKGAAKGNLTELVAVCFATVQIEALPTISERFAEDVFNRSADPSTSYTDAEFVRIAKVTMDAVNKHTVEVENSDVRSTFAALMFIRAANANFSDEIVTPIVATLPEKAREAAVKDEWIASAKAGNYEPMLGAADAGVQPVPEQVIFIAGPQNMETLLADLTGANTDPARLAASYNPIVDAVQNRVDPEVPFLGNGETFRDVEGIINRVEEEKENAGPGPGPGPGPEPGPYGHGRSK